MTYLDVKAKAMSMVYIDSITHRSTLTTTSEVAYNMFRFTLKLSNAITTWNLLDNATYD